MPGFGSPLPLEGRHLLGALAESVDPQLGRAGFGPWLRPGNRNLSIAAQKAHGDNNYLTHAFRAVAHYSYHEGSRQRIDRVDSNLTSLQ